MQLTRDFYGNIKQTTLLLTNPQKSRIGLLSGVEDLDIRTYFNSISELSFKIYKKSNGKQNKYYNRLIIGKLIEAKYMGWFQIKKVEEKQDIASSVKYKEITCLSLENELIYKRIDNIDGVYALYDVSDAEHSLLHIIADQCNWHIGSISNSLLGKYRTFSVDSEKIYNLLTTDIAKSFNCIFKFDTYTKTINAYPLEEIGNLTNITISDKNILQTYVKASDLDKIITKMRVRGGSNADGTPFDIRAVNPTGMDYIINVDYFMTTEWMSQGLINALNTYKAKYNNYQTQYSAALSAFKIIQSDLTGLEAQLDTLESQRDAYISEYKSYVAIHDRVPRSYDSEYQLYNTAYNAANVKQIEIDAKNSEISNIQAQLNTTKTLLDSISADLNMNNNFTSGQLEELDNFLIAGEDYEDDTFLANDSMTETEIIELKLELLHNAENELSRASRPQYTFTTTISNLYTISDDIDSKISYSTWREKFIPGNMITLKFRDDYTIQVRLMSLDFNFNSIDEIEATFSDKRRLDDELIQLSEVLAQADRTSSSFSLAKFGYDAASKQTSAVRDFMNGTLNATLNRVISDDHIQTEISQYGILNRKWLEDQNTYSPYQSWLTQNVLLFTDDNWQSSKTGIGLFTAGTQTFYGVMADVIVGNMVLTEALNITNPNNSIILNKDGAVFNNCSITINKGMNTLTLNATDGIKLTKSGVSQFYIDGNGNAVFGGSLNAATGTFKGSLQAATGTFSGDLIAAGGTFTGTLHGVDGTFTGTLSGDQIKGGLISGTTIKSEFLHDGNTVSLEMSQVSFSVIVETSYNTATAFLEHSSVQFFTSSDLFARYAVDGITIKNSSKTLFSVDNDGDMLCRNISAKNLSCDIINGGTPVTSRNTNDFYYNSTHIEPITTSGGNVGLHG